MSARTSLHNRLMRAPVRVNATPAELRAARWRLWARNRFPRAVARIPHQPDNGFHRFRLAFVYRTDPPSEWRWLHDSPESAPLAVRKCANVATPSDVRCWWEKRATYTLGNAVLKDVYVCPNCHSWTANLPLWKDSVCPLKERRVATTERRRR